MPLDKTRRRQLLDELAPVRDAWKARRLTYHREIGRLCRFLIPSGASVLEIGCGTGDLLHALRPRRGLGIDLSPRMVEIARALLHYRVGFPSLGHRDLMLRLLRAADAFSHLLVPRAFWAYIVVRGQVSLRRSEGNGVSPMDPQGSDREDA